MLLAKHMRHKIHKQYATASQYIKVHVAPSHLSLTWFNFQTAIDEGALETAIQKDRFGLDSKNKRLLEELRSQPPCPPSETHRQLLAHLLKGCTKYAGLFV